jgi:hypothetical protein
MVAAMKNAVFCDVTPCGSCKNLLARATRCNISEDGILQCYPYLETDVSCVRLLLVTSNVVTSSLILVTLMMELLGYSETSLPKRVIRRTIPKQGILHSHCRENVKSCLEMICCSE